MKQIIYKILHFFLLLFYLQNNAFAKEEVIFNSDGNTEMEYQDEITLVADYWCPYNCSVEDDDQGFLVELASRALYAYGIKINYKMMSWHEALDAVQNGDVDGIIGISNIDGKNLLATKNPLEYSVTYAYTRTDTKWIYDGISSLNNKKLGVVMDYVLDDSINSYVMMTFPGDQKGFLIEDSAFATVESIANLIDGDSDIFVEDQRVVDYYINKHGLDAYIRKAGRVSKEKMPIYIALNRDHPKVRQYIRYLEDGIASIKATGEYNHLRLKYDMDRNIGDNQNVQDN